MESAPVKLCSRADSCDYCGQYSTINRCGACLEARYCPKACQDRHMKAHRGLCREIVADREKTERRRELGAIRSLHGR